MVYLYGEMLSTVSRKSILSHYFGMEYVALHLPVLNCDSYVQEGYRAPIGEAWQDHLEPPQLGILVVVDLDCRCEEAVDVGENEYVGK
jgi:hypothetical protein